MPALGSAAVAAPAVAVAPEPASANEIELPLAPVVASLPIDLKAKLMSAPPAGVTVRLQVETVVSQLAFGAVKISFGELRRLVPGMFVNSGGELDNKLINLPLQEILPRLNPELLARRSIRKVEVASEIVGPFAERGRGFAFTTQPLKGAAASAQVPAAAPIPVPPAAALVPPMTIRSVSPGPVAPPMPPRGITPAAPAPGLESSHAHSLPISPLSLHPLPPAPSRPPTVLGANGHGTASGNGNGHGLTPPPATRTGSLNGHGNNHGHEPAPIKMAGAPVPARAGAQAVQTIFVPLADLCGSWPEALKDEIMSSPLAKSKVALESSLILPGLKRGRVVMPWKQLRLLALPSSAPSSNDHLELELPLKVIAPLFLAAQRAPAQPQSKASVSAEIPDLFFGFPQPSAPAAAAPAAPVVPAAPVKPTLPAAPVAPPVPAPSLVPPLPKASEQKLMDSNYFVHTDKGEAAPEAVAAVRDGETSQTDFASRTAHPKDVVARAAGLAGVVGAVVAMQDGLRVASQVPAELNAETLSAFLPQIFERVNQSTRELRMGPLNNLNFTVGNVPWKIFRVNAVYFAAFGRAGETLPTAQLAQLAAELDRKKTQ